MPKRELTINEVKSKIWVEEKIKYLTDRINYQLKHHLLCDNFSDMVVFRRNLEWYLYNLEYKY